MRRRSRKEWSRAAEGGEKDGWGEEAAAIQNLGAKKGLQVVERN